MAEHVSEYGPSYAAFFAPRSHVFETVDFRVPTSLINLKTYFPTTDTERTRQQRVAAFAALLVGFLFAIIGFAVDQLTRGLTIAVYRAADLLIRADMFWLAVLVFTSISLLYALIASLMVVFIAPLGAGSGIPELKSYLNGVRIPGFLATKSLFVKAIGVAFSIASGLICGKQGPMIHAGAIVGAGISQGASTLFSFRLNCPIFRFLRTEAWKRDFSAVGAGVGVAVAFGSPMGAWMWVFEEACTHWTWGIGILTLGGCLTGAVLVRILNYVAAGVPSPGFGAFSLTNFGKLVITFGGSSFPLKDVPSFVVLGVLGGLLGALLPLINKYITLFRYSHVKNPKRRLLETAIIGIATSLFRIIVPYLANDCRDMSPTIVDALQNSPQQDFSRFTCSPSQFSPWAALIYNPSDSVVRALLYTTDSVFPAGAVSVAFIFYFLFIIWTYGIAVPAGVFFPGFLLGSVYGRVIGIAVKAIFPSRTDISLPGFAFLGAVSALAGFTRTISVAVIALEATGLNDASFGAALVALVAKLTGDFLYRRGIYDLHIDLKGIPFLSSQVPHLEKYYNVRLSDVMSSNVIAVRRLSGIGGLLSTLTAYDHNAFPVFVKLRSAPAKKEETGLDEQDTSTDMVFANNGRLVVSHNSKLEVQLNNTSTDSEVPLSHVSSSIVTPSQLGLQATIYDDGEIRLVNFAGPKQRVSRRPFGNAPPPAKDGMKSALPEGSGDSVTQSVSTESSEVVRFELIGTIDRGTLLALLKHECDKQTRRDRGEHVDDDEPIPRGDLDSAWPNRARLKGEWEKQLVERVTEMKMDEGTIDLLQYVDPNPLLMAERAFSAAAYELLRQTGSRHILVVNARVGQIVGIVTRKDILPESVSEVFERYKELKVE